MTTTQSNSRFLTLFKHEPSFMPTLFLLSTHTFSSIRNLPFFCTISYSSPTKYISEFHHTHILILGGTSGIGFCIAEANIEHGAHVCICGSKPAKLEKAISRLQSTYYKSAFTAFSHVSDRGIRRVKILFFKCRLNPGSSSCRERHAKAKIQTSPKSSRTHITYTTRPNLGVSNRAHCWLNGNV